MDPLLNESNYFQPIVDMAEESMVAHYDRSENMPRPKPVSRGEGPSQMCKYFEVDAMDMEEDDELPVGNDASRRAGPSPVDMFPSQKVSIFPHACGEMMPSKPFSQRSLTDLTFTPNLFVRKKLHLMVRQQCSSKEDETGEPASKAPKMKHDESAR